VGDGGVELFGSRDVEMIGVVLIGCGVRDAENRWISHSEDKGTRRTRSGSRGFCDGGVQGGSRSLGLSRDRMEVLRLSRKMVGDVSRTKNGSRRNIGSTGCAEREAGIRGGPPEGMLEAGQAEQGRFQLEVLYRKLTMRRS